MIGVIAFRHLIFGFYSTTIRPFELIYWKGRHHGNNVREAGL